MVLIVIFPTSGMLNIATNNLDAANGGRVHVDATPSRPLGVL